MSDNPASGPGPVIDHVAICVASIDDELAKWKRVLGVAPVVREYVPAQKTDACLLPLGESSIELIEPKGNEGLEKFLAKRGPGIHHIAVRVENIDAELARLAAEGVELIDKVARIGARGHRVAFVHPRALGGVLIELVEAASQ